MPTTQEIEFDRLADKLIELIKTIPDLGQRFEVMKEAVKLTQNRKLNLALMTPYAAEVFKGKVSEIEEKVRSLTYANT